MGYRRPSKEGHNNKDCHTSQNKLKLLNSIWQKWKAKHNVTCCYKYEQELLSRMDKETLPKTFFKRFTHNPIQKFTNYISWLFRKKGQQMSNGHLKSFDPTTSHRKKMMFISLLEWKILTQLVISRVWHLLVICLCTLHSSFC